MILDGLADVLQLLVEVWRKQQGRVVFALFNVSKGRLTGLLKRRALAGVLCPRFVPGKVQFQLVRFLVADEQALLTAGRQIVTIGENLAVHGVSGLLIAGFGDPGLAELKSRVDIPVTGIAEAGIAEAAKQSRRFSIITTTPDLCDAIHRKVDESQASHLLASVRIETGDLDAIMGDIDRMSTALLKLATQCIEEDGAEAILIGGGPLAPAAHHIAHQISVPIVEPVRAGAMLALNRCLQ